MKKITKKANVKLSEREFHCRGKFAALHASHPNDDDLNKLKEFIKEVAA